MERLQHLIVPGLAAHRPILAIAGYDTVDQAGVERRQPVVIDPEPLRDARPEIMHQHVRLDHRSSSTCRSSDP